MLGKLERLAATLPHIWGKLLRTTGESRAGSGLIGGLSDRDFTVDYIRYHNLTRVAYGQQIPTRMVSCDGKPSVVVDLGYRIPDLGVAPPKSCLVGTVHSQPPEMAIKTRGSVNYMHANEWQVGGQHYRKATGKCPHCKGEIQHWDLYAEQPYLVGQITKYVTRQKNGLQDVEKAMHFLQKLAEERYGVRYWVQRTKDDGEADRSYTVDGAERAR